MTEANEFWKIYKLDVIAIPTNRPLQRDQPSRRHLPHRAGEVQRHRRRDRADEQVGRAVELKDERVLVGTIVKRRPTTTIEFQPKRQQGTRDDRQRARSRTIERRGRPILVGTVSIEKSERLSAHARKARHQARGAQRQAPPARGRDRRPGRPQGRRDHRHEHGRPRHRHHPRRQSRDDGLGQAARQVPHAARSAAGRMGRAGRRDRSSASR